MWTLHKEIEFDAAHYLPQHSGKCKNLHGHRWRVIVEITASRLNDQGMVMDFGDIKKVVHKYDHQCLNDFPPFDKQQPTAELISSVICKDIAERIQSLGVSVSVTVFETPGASVTYKL